MYKNRKKMIGVGIASVIALGCFGAIAWGIVYASHQKPLDSYSNSQLAGATSYLDDEGSFKYGKMSFNDWLLYNAPRYIEFATDPKDKNKTTYSFYQTLPTTTGDKGKLIAQLTRSKSNNTVNTSLVTAESNMNLVNSSYTKDANKISFTDNFNWNTALNEGFELPKDNTGSYYSVVDSKNNSLVFQEGKDAAGAESYTWTIKSNTQVELWKKQTTINGDTITVNYSSNALESPLIVTYIKSANLDSYNVSYRSGNQTLDDRMQVIQLLVSDYTNKKDFANSKLSSRDFSLYIPDVF